MSRQDIIDATTNSKRMAQCLKTGDIESAKMLASQQLGANGPLFLEALMSHSVKTPEEIGVLFEKVAKIIEQKKSSMEKRIRNKMKEALESEQAAVLAQQIAAEKMAEAIRERQQQVETAVKDLDDLKKTLRKDEEEKKNLAERRRRLELERKRATKARKKEIDRDIEQIKKREKELEEHRRQTNKRIKQKTEEVRQRRQHLEELKRQQAQQGTDGQANGRQTTSEHQATTERTVNPLLMTDNSRN